MFPEVRMEDPVYVFVDEDGEPGVYGYSNTEEVTLSVFGDFWPARRNHQGEGKEIRALRREELKELLRGGSTRLAHTPMGRTIRSARRVASRFLRHKTAIRSRRPSTLVPIRAGCVRSRTRGEVGMPRNTLSLVIAVLVIILLIVLILQFV
jgi:hypothetical protein